MKLNELLQGIVATEDEREISAIAADSRQLSADTLWLASQGIKHHALDFYHKDIVCAAIVYEPPYPHPPAGAIACPNLSGYLGEIAARFYRYPGKNMEIIGVTGTDGKSSLVYMLAQTLNAAMIGTIGYGVLSSLDAAPHTTPEPLSLQQYLAKFRDNEIQTVAMEVSSHALVQGRVKGVDFNIGVFTNLSRDHLDYHADMEEYFRAKAQLFSYPLREVVINIDESYGVRLIDENRIRKESRLITVSSHGKTHPRSDVHLSAEDVLLNSNGITFTLTLNARRYPLVSPLLARFNVDNLLNTAACLYACGISEQEIVQKLQALHGVPGRAERIVLQQGAMAIIDYSHTPAALQNVLQGVRAHVRGKLWCIFGCGGDRDRGKRPLMAQAAQTFADMVVITDDNPRSEDPQQIVAEIVAGIDKTQAVQVIQPREVAIVSVLEQLQPGDAVVIAGKGHENYQIIGTTKHHFSDHEVVQKWLKNSINR